MSKNELYILLFLFFSFPKLLFTATKNLFSGKTDMNSGASGTRPWIAEGVGGRADGRRERRISNKSP